ncbi:MAG TPA: diaminopimelate epimerase [Candidatus Fusicatenibacter intestinipullorum]|nr:diaminopimelate epimerase [Candidatus Fusicatenibacter intestinipullorum]
MEFSKMHGCGNDYVYVNCMEKEVPNPGAVSEYVSHRRFGIGSDGLILIMPSDKADFRMRMFNADASEGKMCGNGIRCVAKYVYDKGLTDKTTFTVETLSGIKTINVTLKDGKVEEATVEMGKPVFKCTDIPMISDHFVFVDQGLVIAEDVVYNGTAVFTGTPHFVTFVDDVDSLDLEKLGPLFEHHKLFPEGVNTEFVQVIDKNTVKFRVWERGSGETWACGTGACAVAVTCVTLNNAGKRGEELTVIAKGGVLKITYAKDDSIIMKGPATLVFDGIIDIPDEIVSK